VTNSNRCVACDGLTQLAGYYVEDVSDTGVCGQCGATEEVFDPQLLELYTGLSFSAAFVHAHLPRLMHYRDRVLSWADVGAEIARHAVTGECVGHACQAYANRPWRFGVAPAPVPPQC
jgi:hypothetical protein